MQFRENPRLKVAPELRRAYEFFKEHAGYVVGERAAGALVLAKAEAEAKSRVWLVEWEPDEDADWSWMDQPGFEDELARSHEVYAAVLRDEDGDILASLGGIFDPSREYRRVVNAELVAEALTDGAGQGEDGDEDEDDEDGDAG
jgi:hypothetical protein